jgi:hypothetical protein
MLGRIFTSLSKSMAARTTQTPSFSESKKRSLVTVNAVFQVPDASVFPHRRSSGEVWQSVSKQTVNWNSEVRYAPAS